MRVRREREAADREAWEKSVRECAEKLGYVESAPLVFARGSWLGFHADEVRHVVAATWDAGRGALEASARAVLPRSRAVLEARLDAFEGKEPVRGSALSTLSSAALGGFFAWLVATAVMFVFTVPLVEDARRDWTARQERMLTAKAHPVAPVPNRIAEPSTAGSAFIPAAALGFAAAIPLCLWFAASELLTLLSRFNLPFTLGLAVAGPTLLVTPGVAWPGIVAGALAPLFAAAAYVLVRGLWRDPHAPPGGSRWLAGIAGVALVAGVLAHFVRDTDAYAAVRDRVLFGTETGEKLAEFYYRHTPLSAYALRPPRAQLRQTVIVAGPHPQGFPMQRRNLFPVHATGPDEFVAWAQGPAWDFLLINEAGCPWAAEAFEKLQKVNPARARAVVGVTRGVLQERFPEIPAEQLLTPELVRADLEERRPALEKIYLAIRRALAAGDRRRSLRDVAGAATTMSIFLGPPLLLGAVAVWVAAVAARFRSAGFPRTGALIAACAGVFAIGLAWKYSRPESELHRRLRGKIASLDATSASCRAGLTKWDVFAKEAIAAMPDLEAAASHGSVSVRVLAADALGAAAQPKGAEVLGGLLKDPSILVRYRAAGGLDRYPDKKTRWQYLPEALADEIYVAEDALAGLVRSED
jgi:hypothetical protein